MGNNKARKLLLGWQVHAADMMFSGFSDKEIVENLWPDKETDQQKKYAQQRLRNLRKQENFQEYYKSLIAEWSFRYVGKAYEKLGEQIDSNQPWLANKAANDVITQAKHLVTGEDDNTVVLKVEGMPELGTPDD